MLTPLVPLLRIGRRTPSHVGRIDSQMGRGPCLLSILQRPRARILICPATLAAVGGWQLPELLSRPRVLLYSRPCPSNGRLSCSRIYFIELWGFSTLTHYISLPPRNHG